MVKILGHKFVVHDDFAATKPLGPPLQLLEIAASGLDENRGLDHRHLGERIDVGALMLPCWAAAAAAAMSPSGISVVTC